MYSGFISVNLKAKTKAKGITSRLRFMGTRKTGPPKVTLLGMRAMRREAIRASFLPYSLETKQKTDKVARAWKMVGR